MAVAKVPHSTFQKSAFSVITGAGNYTLPRDDVDAMYGPGWPIQPVTRPEDSELPRTLDYPVGVNYTLQPRVGYDGLMPVKALKAAYSNISEVSAPLNLIIRELSGFMPMMRDPLTKRKLKAGHPYEWMTRSPDRDMPFNVWVTKYKKSAKIYAAPAFYMKREGSDITAMEYIDGSTFFLIINSRGNLPRPDEVDPEVKDFVQKIKYGLNSNDSRVLAGMPELARNFLAKQKARLQAGKPLVTTTPAYTQIIKGVPFSFWDRDQVYFVPEPPGNSVDSPYGETYIERSWTWINIIAVMTAFELAHYKTGNTPEGLMMLPKDMFPSMAKLATGEREWNARMADSSQVQHARNRWMPEGTVYIPTKAPDFPDGLYDRAQKNILAAIGVPASELGDKPGSSLGGQGFAEKATSDMTRQVLEAEKEGLEDAFNYVLHKAGVDDAEFYLDYPQENVDPAQQQQDMLDKFSNGLMSLNDILTAQGQAPVGNPKDKENVANMHLIVAGTTIFVMEKIQPDENGIISAKAPTPPGGLAEAGGSPKNPEDLLVGGKKGTPPDLKTVKKIMSTIEESGGKAGTPSNVTYSIPATMSVVDQSPASKMNDDEDLQKHSGVCPEDAAYFGAPINSNNPLTLSGRKHANRTDIVTMEPDGLPAQLALWKPAGGEKTSQANVVGGPQYLREEAAWLLDQSLGFGLVPVAYVTEDDLGEAGAVCWFTIGSTTPQPANAYSPEWVQKAGIFDFIAGQMDRKGKNYLTHPEDITRPVLYDNGMSFPVEDKQTKSDFVESLDFSAIGVEMEAAIKATLGDVSMWVDVEDLLGPEATDRAMQRARSLLHSEEALAKKYNPDQPRAPKGSENGGQWTSDGSAPAPATEKPQDPGAVFGPGKVDDLIAGFNKLEPHLRGFIAVYTPEEYANYGARVFMSADKQSGFAVKADGDLITVFSLAKGRGRQLVTEAVKAGATKLDCYDGHLATLYGAAGFEVVERLTWDDQYKPADWDSERFDNPDVLYMRKK